MTLNGWQRLWVVYMAASFLIVGVLALGNLPEPRKGGFYSAEERANHAAIAPTRPGLTLRDYVTETRLAEAQQERNAMLLGFAVFWVITGVAVYGLGLGAGWVRAGFKQR